jgi:serine/threonine-protein kinase
MATVFAARQLGARGASRVVAVKVMATALADDPAAQQMFEREALIATRIEHPNIVRTYEVGEVEGEIFLAMELVQGATLATLCAKSGGGMPLAIAVRLACDLARGLHAVHELCDPNGALLGVVHQDVTPHNVIVDGAGSAKLLDFGVARMVSQDGSRTERVRGKPAYLAPEQLLLERIDRRADIYALGAVLHELLTGARPPPASTGADASSGRTGHDVRALRSEVPEAIARVVAKAMQVNPDLRYATAEEMRRALTEAREQSGIEAADDSEVGAWARTVAPPQWTLADLERELSSEQVYRAELAEVADLPTMSEPPPAPRAPAPGYAARWVRWSLVSLVALVLGLGAWRVRPHSAASSTRTTSAAASSSPEPVSASSPTPSPPIPPLQPSSSVPSVDSPLQDRPRRPPSEHRPVGHGAATAPTAASAATPSSETSAPSAFLSVWSTPWGHVTVDGVAVGDSPVARLPVTPGSHVVVITTASGGAQQRVVPLKAGEDRTERFVF